MFIFSTQNRFTSAENPFELIHGDEFIYEVYNERKFRISPESFLQVNQKGAEVHRQSLHLHEKFHHEFQHCEKQLPYKS